MNKRAWSMTAPLVVLVALLVASCGDDSPTDTSSAPPPSADVVPSLTLVGSGLTSASEAPLAGVYVHGNYAFVGGMSSGYNTTANIGVRIIDLSNPANPRLAGRIPLRTLGTHDGHSHGDAVATHINSGAFQGDVAIVLYGVPDEFAPASYPQPYGLWDVTDPSNPTFLSVLNLGNSSHGIEAGSLGDKPYDATAGRFSLTPFATPYLILFFEHNEADHWFQSLLVLPDPWPPTMLGQTEAVTVTSTELGEWSINTKGKNHQDGCTGEGVGIAWEAPVTLVG